MTFLAVLPKGYQTEMIFGVGREAKIFLWAAALGILFGICYEALRIFRRTVAHNDIAVFAEDFLFVVFCGVAYFVFVTAAAWGQLRLFVLIGIVCGMIAERLAVGNVIVEASSVIIKAVIRRIDPRRAISIVRNAKRRGNKFVQISKVSENEKKGDKNA